VCRSPTAPPLLDHNVLDRFADALRGAAAPVAASMGPGLSEDEIRTVCAESSLVPSRDAITWFTYWDTLPHPPTKFVEPLPGFQTASLRTCVRSSISLRRAWEEILATAPSMELTVADVYPNAWLVLFTDGGGGHTVLDCSAPRQPSLLRYCFREDFAGPGWAKPISPLAAWLANGTEWMTTQSCRFDPAQGLWLPYEEAVAYWPHFDSGKSGRRKLRS